VGGKRPSAKPTASSPCGSNLLPERGEEGREFTHAAICVVVVGVMLPAWKWYMIPILDRLKDSGCGLINSGCIHD